MKKTGHFIYRTTFLPTGEVYVGYHFSRDINKDTYLGSGIRITNLLKKHSRECFSREILFVFDSAEEALNKERELVDNKFLANPKTLNLAEGGRGGSTVARCLTPHQRLVNGKKSAQKLRGRTKFSHAYLQVSGDKTSQRFKLMTDSQLKQHGAAATAWMADRSKAQAALEKRRQKLIGTTKHSNRGRANQSMKVTGAGNGSAKSALSRVQHLNEELILNTVPSELFAKRYDTQKQRLAIAELLNRRVQTRQDAAKIAEMPYSSFTAVVSKISAWALKNA